MRFKDIDNEQAGLVPDPEPEDDLPEEYDLMDEDCDGEGEPSHVLPFPYHASEEDEAEDPCNDSTCDPLA